MTRGVGRAQEYNNLVNNNCKYLNYLPMYYIMVGEKIYTKHVRFKKNTLFYTPIVFIVCIIFFFF